MKVEKTEGPYKLKEGERHCSELEKVYYARCSYYWPEFHDEGCMIYSTVKECGHTEKLDCTTREEADAIVKRMNDSCECPACHKSHKWKAVMEVEILEQQRLVENIMNRDISTTR